MQRRATREAPTVGSEPESLGCCAQPHLWDSLDPTASSDGGTNWVRRWDAIFSQGRRIRLSLIRPCRSCQVYSLQVGLAVVASFGTTQPAAGFSRPHDHSSGFAMLTFPECCVA